MVLLNIYEIATGGDNDETNNLTLTHPPRHDSRELFCFRGATFNTTKLFLASRRANRYSSTPQILIVRSRLLLTKLLLSGAIATDNTQSE